MLEKFKKYSKSRNESSYFWYETAWPSSSLYCIIIAYFHPYFNFCMYELWRVAGWEQSPLAVSRWSISHILTDTHNIIHTTHNPHTTSRHHMPAVAVPTIPWLSIDFQRPHRPDFELNWIFWSAAAAAAGLGCLSRRVCAVKPKDVVNVFGRCRPVKTRRRLRVTSEVFTVVLLTQGLFISFISLFDPNIQIDTITIAFVRRITWFKH